MCTYDVYCRDEISDEMLQKAALLFSENYGIWGEIPSEVKTPFKSKPGRPSRGNKIVRCSDF
jgi:hypothetical protein